MVAVIDYGASNLRSVQKAFEFLGEPVAVTSDESVIMEADRLVLPGNGAFADLVEALKSLGLFSVIHKFADTGKPFLGICVGMQLLYDKSLEFGVTEGLGFVSGTVRRFSSDLHKSGMKIPHTGWNSVEQVRPHPLFAGIENDAPFYFVHSYYGDNCGSADVIGACDYGGMFSAAVAKDNIMGVQFHPEKSQKAGLKLLENFCKI